MPVLIEWTIMVPRWLPETTQLHLDKATHLRGLECPERTLEIIFPKFKMGKKFEKKKDAEKSGKV